MILRGVPGDGLYETEVCGQPWHGLAEIRPINKIETMVLMLPNGGEKIIQHATNESGDTRLIALPGLPQPRTPEQAAADLLLGKEWRTSAILNYAYIGAETWLYRASTGAIWKIIGSASTILFGVFGGDAGAPVPVAGSNLPSGHIVRDVHPSLTKALISHEVAYTVGGRDYTRIDIYEVVLSDSGTQASLVLNTTLVGSYGISGSTYSETISPLPMNYWEGETCTPSTENHLTAYDYEVTTGVVSLVGYSRSGSITIIESRTINTYTGTLEYTFATPCTATPGNSVLSETHSQTYEVLVNGVNAYTAPPVTMTSTETLVCTTPSSGYQFAGTLDCGSLHVESSIDDPRRCSVGSSSPCDYSDTPGLLLLWPPAGPSSTWNDGKAVAWTSSGLCNIDSSTDTLAELVDIGLDAADGAHTGVYCRPVVSTVLRYFSWKLRVLSNNLLALERYDYRTRTMIYGPFLTPDGIATEPDHTLAIADDFGVSGTLYGSWNPLTGEVAVGNSKRCWF